MQVLTWDAANLIFSYLDPREIILVTTSINTDFRRYVRTKKYSDHLRMNNREDFMPDYAMLDFHVTKRSTYENEGYYVKLCAKESHIDLTDKIFMARCKFPSYVEQLYQSTTGFSKRNRCYIGHCIDGFDKFITKIYLPTLPDGIEYVSSPHSLFRSIDLIICGTTVFKFTSQQLLYSDSISLLFSKNVICLYLDLSQMIQGGFAGIRTHGLGYQQVLFSLQLRDIFSIIKNDINKSSELRSEIGNLELKDMYSLIRFDKFSKRFPYKPCAQTITAWNLRRYRLTKQDSLKIKCPENTTIKRILLCVDREMAIKTCTLITHDDVHVELIGKCNVVANEYVFNANIDSTHLIIDLVNVSENMNIDVHFETIHEITYITW